MSNPFERKFTELFANMNALALNDRALNVFKDKPFTQEYESIYKLSRTTQVVSQIVTFLTTMSICVFALKHIVPNDYGIYISVPIAILFAYFVERIKQYSLNLSAKYHLKYRKIGVIGIVTICVMSVSVLLSLYGATELPYMFYPEPKRTLNTDAVNDLNKSLNATEADIKRLQEKIATTDNWTAENRTLPSLQKQRASIIQKIDDAHKSTGINADTEYTELQTKRMEKIRKMKSYTIIVTVLAELLFLICTSFILYYLFRQYCDTKTDTNTDISLKAQNISLRTQNLATNDYRTKIVSANTRTCKECHQEYIYNHKKQMYCSDKCRIQSWSNKKENEEV